MPVLLDVVVGIAFVYLLLALICTTANEWVAGARGLRARTLEDGIRHLLGPLADDFYRHPLISTLAAPGTRPSYIPTHMFSSAVVDLLSRHGNDAPPAQQVRAGLAALKTRAAPGAPDAAVHAAALEDWFDTAMDRVSGRYKRRIQMITLATAAAVTIGANADTLQIIGVLWRSPADRASLAAAASESTAGSRAVAATYPDVNRPVPAVTDEASAEDQGATSASDGERAVLGQIIGWSADFRQFNQGLCRRLQDERDRVCGDTSKAAACQQVLRRIAAETRCEVDGTDLLATAAGPGGAFLSGSLVTVAAGHAFGWLLTIIAVSLGSAFWFDTLNRFVNIRGTGPAPHEKKKASRA